MNAEPSCIELLVPSDGRLLAAVEMAVSHACERAGLSPGDCRDLNGAVSEICEQTFGIANRNGNRDAKLRVLIRDFDARVEVSLERSDGGPVAPSTGSGAASQQHFKVDGVNHEMRDGRARTVIVKQRHATTRR